MEKYKGYTDDVSLCKKIHKKYGKSFYFGTFLFSKDEHDAVCILYSFFRYPDEYVDTYYKDNLKIAEKKIIEWRDLWRKLYGGDDINAKSEIKQILRATKYVFLKYNIPYEYSEAFISSMLQDVSVNRYMKYEDLEGYMYGSASVVGIMVTHILLLNDEKFKTDPNYKLRVLGGAKSLGEAFQMTNFLRDIKADYQERKRIYIPTEDLFMFNVNPEMIMKEVVNSNFINLMKFEIKRTRDLYDKALIDGIPFLPMRGRLGVIIAKRLYSKILDKIEALDYNVFIKRVYLNFWEKFWYSVISIIKQNG